MFCVTHLMPKLDLPIFVREDVRENALPGVLNPTSINPAIINIINGLIVGSFFVLVPSIRLSLRSDPEINVERGFKSKREGRSSP
jgi:hypothetical protein